MAATIATLCCSSFRSRSMLGMTSPLDARSIGWRIVRRGPLGPHDAPDFAPSRGRNNRLGSPATEFSHKRGTLHDGTVRIARVCLFGADLQGRAHPVAHG